MNVNFLDEPTREIVLGSSFSRILENVVLRTRTFQSAMICPCKMQDDINSMEVIDSNGFLVPNVNCNLTYSNLVEIQELPFEIIEDDIIYLGCFWTCWGHYFTDGLSKAWYLLTDEFKNRHRGEIKIAISFIGNNIESCPQAFLELFDLLGINQNDIIVISKPTKFRNVIVPDNSLIMKDGTRFFAKEYNDTINEITNKVPKIDGHKYDKIYLSRTHFVSGNADFGERSLEKVFKRLGYIIVHPQKYSVKEQIAIFKSAKSFVATTGSIGHNSVFCNSGTEVILLQKCCAMYDYQLVINEARNLNVVYIDTHLSCFVNNQPNNGPFFLYRNANFCRFIKDRYNLVVSENFSTRRYLRYMRICMMRGDMKYRNEAPDFYFEKLKQELQNDSWKRILAIRLAAIVPQKFMNNLTRMYLERIR